MTEEEIEPSVEKEREQDEWAARIPCPDESCIGTMGADGRCRICGQEGEKPPAQTDSPEFETEDEDSPGASEITPEDQDDQDHSLMEDGETESEPVEAWEERELCPDESCIGTLGDDGRCRVCGKSAASE